MNLIDILLWLYRVFIGVVFAATLGRVIPPALWILTFFAGYFAALPMLRAIVGVIDRWRRLRPDCRRGVCRQEDYRRPAIRPDGIEWFCRCGDRYLEAERQPDGTRRFLFLNERDETEPYMRQRRRGPWQRDDVSS